MIYFLVIGSAFLFAYEETQEWLNTKWGDIREHIISVFHRASLIAIGYYSINVQLYEAPLLFGVYWLLTDGIMNLLKKRNFFAVSNSSGNPFEEWNIVKFMIIGIGIIIEIIYRSIK